MGRSANTPYQSGIGMIILALNSAISHPNLPSFLAKSYSECFRIYLH